MGSHQEPIPTLSKMVSNRYKDTIPLDLDLDTSLAPSQLATLSTILTHRTIRSFHSTPLPSSTLPSLLACAQSASTSSMLQTYSILAIRDPAHKAAVAQLSGNQPFLHSAPLFLIFCADLIDAAIAGQNAAIAAEALGLGVCYVGGVRNHAAELTPLLRLPPRVFALFGIAIGYADSSVEEGVKPRLPMNEVLHMETWDNSEQERNVERYDELLGRHYHRYLKVGRKHWSEFVARWHADGGLEGREHVRGVLEGQGFGLE
ncbi:Nitroreductase-like protein [Aspergillus pseudodeflectus]|uniref:Nitroreductase-like protein n=1 Tax=Aspergillus pseudodeflectus TaxID=176178 RepID=A0ABR4L4D8_9EURO